MDSTSSPLPGRLAFATPTSNTSNASNPPSESSSSRAPGSHIRSCTVCRSRKVKCDRQQPCGHCVRAGTDCVYPPGPGRAPKRPRRALDTRVLDRLAHLEDLLRRLDTEVEKGRVPALTGSPRYVTPAVAESDDGSSQDQVAQQFGRLVIDETRSCYVSNILWASLGDEIEELRDLLYEPASEADDREDDANMSTDSSVVDSATSLGANAAIMGYQALAQSLSPYHPPLSQSVALLEIFKVNVAPLVHIFHMPTMICLYWDAVGSPESLDRNTEALLFAIYYSTIISMEPQQCERVLGLSRASALKQYQFAVQQAMARADLLNTQSIVLLQAVVLFLSALRNEDASRTAWSLTALIFHIAQAMGLHRDGAIFGLRPLETELRRRLWWHICLLDIRSSEYHGCEPIVHESMFDTRMPLNVNDSDLTADMTEPPPERDEATEMTLCLIRCEVMRVVWKTGYVQPSLRLPGKPAAEGLSLQDRAALAKDLQQRLEERYLKRCNMTTPFCRVCVTVARLIIARNWLVVYYPLCHKDNGANLPSSLRDRLLLTSIHVLELSNVLLTSPEIAHWQWHSKTHIQWHAVAFVLSEICSRPPSTDCDRAWEYAQTLYNRWEMKEHKGNMWRPIKRLMAKAQYVREVQKTSSKPDPARQWRVAIPSVPPSVATPQPPSAGVITTPGMTSSASPMLNDWSVATTEPLDPFFETFSKQGMLSPGLVPVNQGEIDYSMVNWVVNPDDMNFGMSDFLLP